MYKQLNIQMNEEKQMEPFQRQNPVNKEEVCGQRDHRSVKSNFFINQAISVQGKNPIKESLNNESSKHKFVNNQLSSYESSLPLLGQQMQNCPLDGKNKLSNCKEIQTCPQSNKIEEDESYFKSLFLSLLSDITSKHLFSQQAIEFLQRVILEDFISNGILNEEQTNMVNVLIYLHINHLPQMSSQYKCQIKQQYPNPDQIDNYLTTFSQLLQNENQQHLEQFQSLKVKIKKGERGTIRKEVKRTRTVSCKGNQIFIQFLNKSIEKLKLNRIIQEIFIKRYIWPFGYSVTSFIHRLIILKKFLPKLFPDLVKDFNATVGKFKQHKIEKDYQIFAKRLLADRYLNFINFYVENDKIQEAVKIIFNIKTKQTTLKRIHLFQDYQRQIKLKAQKWELEKKKSHGILKETETSMDSLQQHPTEHNMIEEKSKENGKKVQFEAFKQKYYSWNSIQKPKYFLIQISDSNSVKFDAFSEMQLDISK